MRQSRHVGENIREYGFGNFRFAPGERVLSRNGVGLDLPPKAFALLDLLVSNAGRLVTKQRIMETLWPDTFVEEANLANLIALIRKTLADPRERPAYIQTVSKRGYRFIAPVIPPDSGSQASASPDGREGTIRIIVFPFRSDPAEGGNGYLGYGLAEAIGATLAEFNAFTVRAMHSALLFDPLLWDPKAVAEKADVDLILTGALVQTGNRIHATTELVDDHSGTLTWSKVWDIPQDDLFRLHTVVVQLVIRSLVLKTNERQTSTPAGVQTVSAEAYQLYLRAGQLQLKRSPENMTLARDVYLACTQLDPGFAMAWARLGRCCRWLEKFGGAGSYAEGGAERAFQEAFRLNPDLAVAHSAYTPIQCDRGDAQQAMVRLLQVLSRNESNPDLFGGLVHACRYCGLLTASLAAHQMAIRLDRTAATSVAHTWFALGDYEQALHWYDRKTGLYLDAAALASTGQLADASALLWSRRERFAVQPGLMHSLQFYVDADPARGIDALYSDLSQWHDPEICFYLSRQASAFGDTGLALQLLRKAVDCGYWNSVPLLRDPWFQPLQSAPGFNAILAAIIERQKAARRAFHEAAPRLAAMLSY